MNYSPPPPSISLITGVLDVSRRVNILDDQSEVLKSEAGSLQFQIRLRPILGGQCLEAGRHNFRDKHSARIVYSAVTSFKCFARRTGIAL